MKMKLKLKHGMSLALATVLAFNISYTAFSAGVKEEVVYVILNEDGSTKNIYVVNSFENNEGGLSDYGNYESVRNLSTEDALTIENGEVMGNVPAGKFYYEGKLTETKIPWNISIKYKLDGTPINASELAGKSGNVEIGINISENEGVYSEFYENYALQISTSFDTNKCKNIVAEGATIANAGENKNISYTLLPKKEANYTITTEATGFEMGAISINGIPFSLNLDIREMGKVDTISEDISEGFAPLKEGVASLDDGVNNLEVGAESFNRGINELVEQTNPLINGSKEVQGAISKINSSLSNVNELSSENDSAAQLSAASENFSTGLTQLTTGLTAIPQDSDEVKKLLNAMAQSEDPNVKKLVALYNSKMEAVAKTAESASKLSGSYTQINAGVSKLTKSLGGLGELSAGVNLLMQQYNKFHSGIVSFTDGLKSLASGYDSLYNGIGQLKDGTFELRDKTKDIDKELQNKIDDAINNFSSGEEFMPISFVSDKNTNVNSVQFLIKVNAISIPEVEVVKEQEKTLSFWDKFMNLFK